MSKTKNSQKSMARTEVVAKIRDLRGRRGDAPGSARLDEAARKLEEEELNEQDRPAKGRWKFQRRQS